jgi:selenide,water dikinase
LKQLPASLPNPDLLVGLETSDDAGVFRLTDEIALVQTVDYFTPIVDDPYDFGQIAAANALSDVYAMGGKPITVLNIVGFPISKLDKQILADILRGAADKVAESGATLVGGHSIDDQEPKFGLAVTGIIHPDKIKKNQGAKAGDRLILTKPIGVGLYTTALKRNRLDENDIRTVTKVMATLNKAAAETSADFDVHACTDVTGFGLLGHALEMVRGTRTGLEISWSQVPMLEKTLKLAHEGMAPGGSHANYKWLVKDVTYTDELDEAQRLIMCDAVTSGGLLMAVPADEADELVQRLRDNGVSEAAVIGTVTDQHPGKAVVTR